MAIVQDERLIAKDSRFDGNTALVSPRSRRRPPIVRYLITAVLIVVLIYIVLRMMGWLWSKEADVVRDLTYKVRRGDLVVTVIEDGNLESSNNLDIKCEVPGGSTILSIVTNGSRVSKGDVLVKLDDAALQDQYDTQLIAMEKAKATKIDAETAYDAAVIALQEYEQGNYPKELQTLRANITVAEENLRSAQNMLQHTERMARKGYVTALQREAQEFAVKRAQIDLDVANVAKDVLERFTKAKMIGDLKSKVDSAEAKKSSEEEQFKLEQTRLERLRENLKKCVIVAPHDGLVEYANEPGGGRGGQPGVLIEEGASVRERQSILRMPDLANMQVKVLIHESRINDVHVGLAATIRAQDLELHGTVTYVANQAEAPSWFAPTVRKYAALVRIEDPVGDLRTGMTAAVEILSAHHRDVLTVPLQVVAEVAGKFHCWVKTPSGPRDCPVQLGEKSITEVEIISGLQEGDEVVQDPRRLVEAARREVPRVADPGDAGRLGGAASAASTQTNPAPANRGARGEKRPPSKGGGPAEMMDKLDRNKDGKLSQEELPEQLQTRFAEIDRNKDGLVDSAELAVALERLRQVPNGSGTTAQSR